MVSKRDFSEEEEFWLEENPFQESKRRLTFETVVRDVMRGLSLQEISSQLEPLLRKVIREEVERVFLPYVQSFPRSLPNRIEAAGSSGWQLEFTKKMPRKLFTGNKIEAEDNTPVQVIILDANSKRIVTSGRLSSIKIEILVLDGDFGSDRKDDWAEEEFDACVVREREGKRPLVVGELQITLKDGIGCFVDVTFTDNSSWTRSGRFRLGVKAVRGICNDERIRKARSEPFIVKDHRGELYQKHYPPSLGDEVWRLDKIGKDGAFHKRLAARGIETVQDFLRFWVIDNSSLRTILGGNMSTKTWENIVQHATSCTLDNKRYMYNSAERGFGLLLNSIYKVVGVTFDGHDYRSLDNLSLSQKMLVEDLKQHAYNNLKDIVEVDFPSVGAPPMALPLMDASFPGLNLDMQDFPIAHQDQPATQVGLNNPILALPYGLEEHGHFQDVAVTQGSHQVQPFPAIQRNSFKMKGPLTTDPNDGNQWVPCGSAGEVMLEGHFTGDDISQFHIQNWHPGTTSASWGQGNGYSLTSGDETGIGFFSPLPQLSSCMTRNCKNMGWFKLRAVIKWGISVRRDVAARRRARAWPLGY